MKLLVLADLHLDMWFDAHRDPLAGMSQRELESVDLCIVAGDLCNKAKVRWRRCLGWLATRIDPAKICAFEGNHEPYGGAIGKGDKLAGIAAEIGVRYAQKREIRHGNHRFLCCTLWTDFQLTGDQTINMLVARKQMNDYRQIRVAAGDYRRLTPQDTVALHADHRAWLRTRLADPFDGETAVVTHHAPHPKAVDCANALAPAYAAYLTDLIIEFAPARWIYGHTHRPARFQVGDTELINASVGYPGQVQDPPAPLLLTLI